MTRRQGLIGGLAVIALAIAVERVMAARNSDGTTPTIAGDAAAVGQFFYSGLDRMNVVKYMPTDQQIVEYIEDRTSNRGPLWTEDQYQPTAPGGPGYRPELDLIR